MNKNEEDEIKIIKIYSDKYPHLTKDQIRLHAIHILNYNLRQEEKLPSEIEFVLKYKIDEKEIEHSNPYCIWNNY